MGNRERICRLCLQKCGQNFKNIEGNNKEAMEILLPKINLAVSDAPVMCTNCAKTLEKCFDFKQKCLCRHRSMVSYANGKDSVKRNLKYLHGINEESDNSNGIQDPTACGLCANSSNSCSIVALDMDEEKIMLEKCFPELDLSITKICIPCHESLMNCFHFIIKCSTAEENIQKCSRNSDINNDSVTELNHSSRVSIQLEQIFCNEGANSDEEVAYRDEVFVKMMDQIYHDVEQFTSEDVSSVEEDNTPDAIKEEGELLEETENNVEKARGSFVKKEDQNFYKEIQFRTGDLFAVDKESNQLDSIKVKEEFFEKEDNVEYKSENCIKMEEQESNNLHFGLKVPMMKVGPNHIARIKPEEIFHEGGEAVNGEMKCDNFLETENKKLYGLSHFTSNNVLTSEEDCAKFDVSKIEGICCEKGENAERENENLATIGEEQKYNLNEEVDIKPDLENSYRLENGIILSELEAEPKKPCINRQFVDKIISELRNIKHAVVHKNSSEVIIYKCDFCSFQTKYKSNLTKHMLTHKDPSEVIMYSCDDCSFQTRNKRYLTKHMLTHKDPLEVTMYNCGSCVYQTKCKLSLIRHMLIHKNPSDVTIYNCDFCSFKTKHKNYLTTHMLTHKDPSDVTIYNCDDCSFQARNKRYLTKHMLTHRDPSEAAMYKCGSCLYQTKYRHCLIKHTLVHKDPSDINIYNCDSCSFQTKYKTNLTKHMLTHKDPSEVIMYSCDNCSFQTGNKRYLTKHMLRHKDPLEVTMYNCGSCVYQTKRKLCLIRHMLIHKNPSDVTMHNCDLCSFQTKHKSYLNQHLLKHKDPSDVPMYNCGFCSFQARSKRYLTRHMLKHKDSSEVTMYKCGSCLYQTKRRGSLIRHILVHKDPSDINMYKCNLCSFQTKRKANLKRHLLTHKIFSEDVKNV